MKHPAGSVSTVVPATAYTAYAKTVDHYAARLHAPEAETLRHAADAVFFAEDDRDGAVERARALLAGALAHEDRLGPDVAETIAALLDAVQPVLATA
jgi:hypothetical protein